MRITLLAVALILAAMFDAAADEVVVVPSGTTLVTSEDAGGRVKVKFVTQSVDIGEPGKIRRTASNSMCTYSRIPCSLIREFEIVVKKKKLVVPQSAIADISDVNSAELIYGPKTWRLLLRCGDASEASVVELKFDTSGILERHVYSGSGRDLLEETKYHLVIYN